MAYNDASLIRLSLNDGFSIWLYRTSDTRLTALSAGYFAGAAGRLAAGDVMYLQASDALTLTTVRIGTTVAAGLVIDSSQVPFNVGRQAHHRFSVSQVVTAVLTALLLMPLAGSFVAGSAIAAEAAVQGPVTEVSFSIRDAGGAVVSGPQSATVTAGTASANLTAPAAGTGYRVRVEAVGDPEVYDVSPPFTVTLPFALLSQAGDALLLEDGSRLLV
jgi:hypothetical protein